MFLLNLIYKIYANITQYIETYTEEILGDCQCGCRKEWCTTDGICTLKQIIKKPYKFNIEIHQLFMDSKQKYDSVSHQQLHIIRREYDISSEIVNLVKVTLRKTMNKSSDWWDTIR